MARNYDIDSILGFHFEETPETLGYDLSSKFSAQVSQALDEKGMSLKELAGKMGITQPSLCKMLGPKSNMTMKTIAKIAIALDMDVEAPRLLRKNSAANVGEIDGMESSMISKTMALHVNKSRVRRPAAPCYTLSTAKEG